MNVEKQIAYWKAGALEDFEVANILLDKRKLQHSMFMAHLALEKILKAHVVKVTALPPPKSHQLLYLATLGDLKLTDDMRKFFLEVQQFNIEGRYPSQTYLQLRRNEVEQYIQRTADTVQWLIEQL